MEHWASEMGRQRCRGVLRHSLKVRTENSGLVHWQILADPDKRNWQEQPGSEWKVQ